MNEVQEFNWPPIIKHGGIDDHFLVGEFYLRSNHQTSHSRVVVRFTRYQIGVSMAKFKVVIEVWNKILKRWDHHPSCLGTIHNKIGPSVSFMTDDEARNLWDDCCFNDKFTQFIPMTNIEIDRDFPTTLHEDMPSLEEVEREDWKAYNNY